MSQIHKIRKAFIFWLNVGLLAATWVGQTHAHFDKDPYEADQVCSVCLAGESLNHYIAAASFGRSVNSAVFERINEDYNTRLTLVSFYYFSRAPPVAL